MHKTFYDLINDFRLEKFKKILDTGNECSYSVEEIATRSGNYSYSSFKKKYEQNPTIYLKSK
jgi:transcriptional regulator GlxA family with amidase domain